LEIQIKEMLESNFLSKTLFLSIGKNIKRLRELFSLFLGCCLFTLLGIDDRFRHEKKNVTDLGEKFS